MTWTDTEKIGAYILKLREHTDKLARQNNMLASYHKQVREGDEHLCNVEGEGEGDDPDEHLCNVEGEGEGDDPDEHRPPPTAAKMEGHTQRNKETLQ